MSVVWKKRKQMTNILNGSVVEDGRSYRQRGVTAQTTLTSQNTGVLGMFMRIAGVFLLCVSGPLLAANDCPDANTTYEVGLCLAEQLEQHEVTLQHYLTEARGRYVDDPLIVESIGKAHQIWLSYRQDQCSSIYNIWREGSIRSIMGYNCSIRMAQLRTHQIWHSYLTSLDSAAPLLPEPQLADGVNAAEF